MRSLIEKFVNGSISSKLALIVLIGIWIMVFVAIVAGFIVLAERRGGALEPNLEIATPSLILTPTGGTITTPVTLQGSGWTPGSTVLIYLSTLNETELPPYAVMSVVPDSTGQFIATLTFPANVDSEEGRAIKVVAREIGRGFTTHTLFTLSDFGGQQMDRSADPVPTAIPTPVVVKDTVSPTSPGIPLATANTNVNIRSGPGLVYPVIGVLQIGQNAEVTGLSPDKAWWQIKFSGATDGRGWVSAAYVTTENTGNLPIVQLIVLPVTPTPVPPAPVSPAPTQIIITDWRGEYFNNPDLNGTPVLVRNDPVIQFSWGPNAPAPEVTADNFSVRWTRTLHFSAGRYLFKVLVDDGVRLWVDGNLVIDRWYPTDPKTYTVEVNLTEGAHRLTLEYFEFRYDAQVRLDWERIMANEPPVARAGGPYRADEGSAVTLDGRGSRDPDGSIARYEWDLNYNGRDLTVDATGPVVSTHYPDGPMTIVVALRVMDNKGATSLATTQVTVQNVPPTVRAGGPYHGLVNNPITLNGTAIDPSAPDQLGLVYRWEFGDGSTGIGPQVVYSYARAGTYTARLTVTDKDGGQNSNTAVVQVTAPSNQPPRAVISGPAKGWVGEILNFSGSGSSDSDGRIVGYAWDFGNGTTGNGVNVSQSYQAAGHYQVTLMVTDNGGLTHTAAHTVQIEQPAPINQPPVAIIEGPTTAAVNEPVIFNGRGSSDSDGEIVSYVWDFGDGARGSEGEVEHTFNQSGTFTVVLTVADNEGLTASARHTIQIIEATNREKP